MASAVKLAAGPTGRLMAQVVAVDALDDTAHAAMWRVFRRYYDDIARDRFEADLAKKTDVILLLDSGDRSIQGFSTIEVYERSAMGRDFVAVFSGDTIIEEAYWGQKALHRAFVRYVVRLKLSRPFTPVYWFLISKGYKTYLLLSRNFTSYWPRHDANTPEFERQLIADLASGKYGEAFREDRGVLEFASCEGRLKGGIAPIDPAALGQPDIRFFVDRNPGHARGDELCCLGKVDLGLWSKFTSRLMHKAVARTSRTARRIWAVATTAL